MNKYEIVCVVYNGMVGKCYINGTELVTANPHACARNMVNTLGLPGYTLCVDDKVSQIELI